jgi:hypothetical protein
MSKVVVTAAKKEDPRIWALNTRDGHVYLVPLQKKQSLCFFGENKRYSLRFKI